MTVDDQQGGLRERTKARRRLEIQKAGMRLFAERGYQNTTVVEIAEAAEVAPRTVSGYFVTKVEIATAFADDIASSLAERLVAEPRGELPAVLDGWLRHVTDTVDVEAARLARAMYEANPGLRSLSSAHVAEAADAGAAAVARWTGLPATHPMVAITLAAIGAVLAEYLNSVFEKPSADGLHDTVVAYVRALLDGAMSATASSAR